MTPKTTSLNFSRLNCQIPNYKTKILELSKKRESNSIYIDFVQKFLNYIPIDSDFSFGAEFSNIFSNSPLPFRMQFITGWSKNLVCKFMFLSKHMIK
ncbi:MAG: hypothetical protein O7C59_09860, partial [Rickettsia endosymbiont of Ixodes persulcatus]|nr:hypothetical protein [Rickettsia endosymbiont of Ixodes persulcatus]